MADDNVIEFPGNRRPSPAFESYLRRCGRPEPLTGRPCTEPVGHVYAHQTGIDGDGMRVGWWDNPPSVSDTPEEKP